MIQIGGTNLIQNERGNIEKIPAFLKNLVYCTFFQNKNELHTMKLPVNW